MAHLGNVPALLRRRRFRLYGVGAARSGTTSLTAMLGAYRSAHEVDSQRLIRLAADVHAGDVALDSSHIRRVFRYRSVRFNLEADVAGHLNSFAGPIARLYPDAQLALLVRDCFSWLNSRIELALRRPAVDAVRFPASHDGPHHSLEQSLEAAGVRPIASYLRRWADITAGIIDAVPAERLLVIRTEDLDESVPRLAAFIGVAPATIRVVHTNRTTAPTGLLAQVPAAFVVDQAEAVGVPPIMERFWGNEWRSLAESRLPG